MLCHKQGPRIPIPDLPSVSRVTSDKSLTLSGPVSQSLAEAAEQLQGSEETVGGKGPTASLLLVEIRPREGMEDPQVSTANIRRGA